MKNEQRFNQLKELAYEIMELTSNPERLVKLDERTSRLVIDNMSRAIMMLIEQMDQNEFETRFIDYLDEKVGSAYFLTSGKYPEI